MEFASPALAASNLSRFLPHVPCGRPAICQLSSPKRTPLTSPPTEDRSASIQVRWKPSGAAVQEDDDDGFEDESPTQAAPTPAPTWSAAASVAKAIAEIEKCSGDVLRLPFLVQLTGGQAADKETSYPNSREAVVALRKYLPTTLVPRPGLQVPPIAKPSPTPELAAADPPEPALETPLPLSRARSSAASSPELAPIQGSNLLAKAAAAVPEEAIRKEDDGYDFEDEDGFEDD